MLLKLFRRLTSASKAKATQAVAVKQTLDEAFLLVQRGEYHAAIVKFRDYLKGDPYNVGALNDLGACLSYVGAEVQARETFALAYSLDDTSIPVIVNYAQLLSDRRLSGEAMPLLLRAKICEPNFSQTDSVYGSICLAKGDANAARRFHLQSWLANFDNLRLANCYLFSSSYSDIDEAELASEHRFWAETLAPIAAEATESPPEDSTLGLPPINGFHDSPQRRIRIGYWSPDFRSHSVRYFSRPLIENHDRSRFEVFLYHDCPVSDEQTELFRTVADQFHPVSDLPDQELGKLIRSHQLDILVELAGHTSFNRLSMMQQRLARLQITGLGYPATTGLASIDAKLSDVHVSTPDDPCYYTEQPLALPSSFWCFDPMEDVPIDTEPPVTKNGYVTFACVGNVAKMTASILDAWKEILGAVKDSRLVLRSISFEDVLAQKATEERMAEAGFDLSRVDFLKPERGTAYFASYNQIDIVLDTFPFNGGTTTCFATYMGVPVVSKAGNSLISRMGLSILTNLGLSDLVSTDLSGYVASAVKLATDVQRLRMFRIEARSRFQRTGLGNGKLFAGEFESACTELLVQKNEGIPLTFQSRIAYLPERELVRRAYAVMQAGQVAAAERILDHCLKAYPLAAGAHILRSHQFTLNGQYEEAANYLLQRLEDFSVVDQVPALISVARQYLLLERYDALSAILTRLHRGAIPEVFDQMQTRLFAACITGAPDDMELKEPPVPPRQMHFLVPCDSTERYKAMCAQIRDVCGGASHWTLTFERCEEHARTQAYLTAMSEQTETILVIAQKNVEIHSRNFPDLIADALSRQDLVGFAGARRWIRMDWRTDEFKQKAGCFLGRSSEKQGFVEIHWIGEGYEARSEQMSVLDGTLIALDRSRGGHIADFDEELLGCDTLLEEVWAHASFKAGKRLAVLRDLGVFVDSSMALDASNKTDARVRCSETMGFSPFEAGSDDGLSVSAPQPDMDVAIRTMRAFMDSPSTI